MREFKFPCHKNNKHVIYKHVFTIHYLPPYKIYANLLLRNQWQIFGIMSSCSICSVRQINWDGQHHWCPKENIDCKLGFLSSLCSAISFKFHHDINNKHHLCFCHSFIHFPSHHSPSHYSFKPWSISLFLQAVVHLIIPSNHSPFCHSNSLSRFFFQPIVLEKMF